MYAPNYLKATPDTWIPEPLQTQFGNKCAFSQSLLKSTLVVIAILDGCSLRNSIQVFQTGL